MTTSEMLKSINIVIASSECNQMVSNVPCDSLQRWHPSIYQVGIHVCDGNLKRSDGQRLNCPCVQEDYCIKLSVLYMTLYEF